MSLANFLYTVHKDRRRREVGSQIAQSMGYDLDPVSGMPIMDSAPASMQGPENTVFGGGGAMPSDIGQAANAIGTIESNNRWDAKGPVIDNPKSSYNGDRAYGRFQVMGKNIPSWTQEVLGESLTPEQFLANPQAQQAVFDAKFGENMNRYGFADAASIWHSGQRLENAQGRSDGYTATPDYVRKAQGVYGQGGQQQPQMEGTYGRADPSGAVQRPGAPGPAPGAMTPFGGQPQQMPAMGAAAMPDVRLPYQFQQMGMGLLSEGYFQEALQMLSPMQKYAIDSNVMRSEYSIDSTLTQEAHQAKMIEIDRQQDRQDFRHLTASGDALQRSADAAAGRVVDNRRLDISQQGTDIDQGRLALDRDKFEAEGNLPPSLPNHLTTPYIDLTERQDMAMNAINTLEEAINLTRDPQAWRSGKQAGEEEALIADIRRLAIQDARVANGGAEPNQDQIENAMEAYGYDPARRRWTGSAGKQEERLRGLRDRWAQELSDSERQFNSLGITPYRDPARVQDVQDRLRSEREKAAAAAAQQGVTVD